MIDELKNVMVLVNQTELEKLNERLSNLEKLIVASLKKNVEDEFQWIESTKVPALLGVSRKTWQTYRDKRLIPFSQYAGKIHVRLSDLNDFMEKNKIPAIRN